MTVIMSCFFYPRVILQLDYELRTRKANLPQSNEKVNDGLQCRGIGLEMADLIRIVPRECPTKEILVGGAL